MLTTEIDVNTNYTVSVETITGYLACADQSYTAGYQTERNITFQYRAEGAYIEATDGTIYTSSTWSGSGKTANSIVLITTAHKFRIALTDVGRLFVYNEAKACTCQAYTQKADAQQCFNGYNDTELMKISYGLTSTYAAGAASNFTFPNGNKGYLPSLGEFYLAYQNKSAIDACLSACGGTAMNTVSYWTSTYNGPLSVNYCFWGINWQDGYISNAYIQYGSDYSGMYVRAFGIYE